MNCLEAIETERDWGRLFCGSIAEDQYQFLGVASIEHSESVSAIAVAFGLSSDAKCYREIDAELARAILICILHRDLAYRNEIMSLARAEELASQFIQEFGKTPCHIFTNGEFEQEAGAGLVLRRWNSATDATGDTGVLVLGPEESACVWVADED